MGYFASGTEKLLYEERYCSRCVHYQEGICPVMVQHVLYNYEEANKPDSFLHILIPRNSDGDNEQCTMFHHEERRKIPRMMRPPLCIGD